VGDGELLGLRTGAYECDLIEFRHLLAEGDERALAQAVALYRGSLLQGFSLTDAPVFEEWVRSEDTRLSQACLDALDRLAAWTEAGEAWATAIGYALRMVQMDPLWETAHQRLMRLYLRQGDVASALRQYRQLEDLLLQELELAPSPETQALLYDALRLQRSPKTLPAYPARLSSRQPTALPFIGREPLLQQLSTISKEVQSGRGMTVLLQGEGGIGKSRLLDELVSRLIAGSPPWIILQGTCSPFDDLLSPGPFLEALQNGPAGDITELLVGQDASVHDARGRFSWGVLQTIHSLTLSVPLLFVIDDLQWANSSTLNLFGFLSMRIHRLPVMLVGTVQHAEAIPALQRLVTLGRRRGELHVLPLTPLGLDAISALLTTYGLNPSSLGTLAEWLHARTAGNPFLLTEVLAQMRAEGILQPMGDGWQLDTTRWLRWRSTFTLPETTHDLVAWRLADLSPEARHLLDVLAVPGRPLAESVLRAFPGIQASSFPMLVDDLTTRGLLIESPDSTLALPHHLLREALLHRMSNLHRRTIHQQLAETLEAHASLEDDAVLRQIALYAVAGEDIDRARRYGLRVLPGLPQEYMGAETVDFVHHLHDLLAPAASPGEMVQLTRALGTLHQTLGQLEMASHWHQQNFNWAQKVGDSAAQAEACFEMAELALVSNDYSTAARVAQEGLSTVAFRPSPSSSEGLPAPMEYHPLIGRGHRLLGAALAMEGSDLTAAENQLRVAVPALRQSGNQGDLCAALFELGNIAAQRGELPRALDLYEEAARAAETGRVHYYLALAHNNYAYHSLLLGQVAVAQ